MSKIFLSLSLAYEIIEKSYFKNFKKIILKNLSPDDDITSKLVENNKKTNQTNEDLSLSLSIYLSIYLSVYLFLK